MDRRYVIREIVALIAQAAARERAMADHLEEGIRMLRSPLLLDKIYLETWIVQANALRETSQLAHQPEPGKSPQVAQVAPGSTIPVAGEKGEREALGNGRKERRRPGDRILERLSDQERCALAWLREWSRCQLTHRKRRRKYQPREAVFVAEEAAILLSLLDLERAAGRLLTEGRGPWPEKPKITPGVHPA